MENRRKARKLLERAKGGEQTRELVEELDSLGDADDEEVQQKVSTGLHIILADEPGLLVENYEGFFTELNESDNPRPPTLITFSFIAEDPPGDFRLHMNSLLRLLNHGNERVQALTCRTLSRLARKHPLEVQLAESGLRSLLDHSNSMIRGEACIALGRIGATDAKEDIMRLQIDSSSDYVRETAKWATDKIEASQEQETEINIWETSDLMDYTFREFEELIARLWDERGYSTKLTPKVKDGGYDVEAVNGDEVTYIEAKRNGPANRVTRSTVLEARGLLRKEEVDEVIVVTSSRFTKPAREVAEEDEGLELIRGRELCSLLTLENLAYE